MLCCSPPHPEHIGLTANASLPHTCTVFASSVALFGAGIGIDVDADNPNGLFFMGYDDFNARRIVPMFHGEGDPLDDSN